MKYLLLASLLLLVSACWQRPCYENNKFIETSITKGNDRCFYFTDSGSFSDSCGKFNIGDTVTTIKIR